MRGVALARRAIDDAQGKGARRDDTRVVMLPRAAGADKAVLGAAVAVDLRVLESFPIRRLVAEPADIALGDLVERQRGDLGRHLVAGGSHRSSPSANGLHLFQLIGDLVEPGLGAGLVLVAAGRARYADRADNVIADLDRQPAGGCADVAEPQRETGRVFLLPLAELARGGAEGARRIGLAEAVFDRVRRGIVAAQLHNDL